MKLMDFVVKVSIIKCSFPTLKRLHDASGK